MNLSIKNRKKYFNINIKKQMEGLTLTIGQRNWNIVVDYGFKWFLNVDLEKIPNIFNAREFIKNNFIQETPLNRVKRYFKNFVINNIPFFKKYKMKTETDYTIHRENREFRSINIPVTKTQREKATITSY